jgi:copper transport protein
MTRRSRRWALRLAAVLSGVGVVLVTGSTPAWAHAQLLGSDPAPDARLSRPPAAVTLRFDEAVEAGLGSVRLFDGRGRPRPLGAPRSTDRRGAVVRASLGTLGEGTYVVSWRVTSADGHPVRGAFVFTVGTPDASPAATRSLLERVLAAERGDVVVGGAVVAARAVGFAAVLVLVGAFVGLGLWWPQGRDDRRARRVLSGALAVATAAAVAAFLLQGPYVTGLGPRRALDVSLWREVAGTRTGAALLARLGVLALLCGLARALAPRRAPAAEHPLPGWWPAAAGLGLVALGATHAYAGHAATGSWGPAAVVIDTAHLLAAGVWVGGLVLLFVAVLPGAGAAELMTVLPRWSGLALGAVGVLVATGVAQSVRQLPSPADLIDTDYGRLLLVKTVLVLGVVVVAAHSRDLVERHWRARRPARSPVPVAVAVGGGGAGSGAGVPEADGPPEAGEAVSGGRDAGRGLRRSVLAETVILTLVVVVTALLTNTAPPRAAAGGPFFETLTAGRLRVDVTMSPGRPGPNEVHLYAFTGTGLPTDVIEMTAELSRPEDRIEPIRVPLLRAGPGHYLSSGFTVPFAGDWTLRVGALVDPTTRVTASTRVPVR